MTFESYALYPHMTVFENIASPLRARKVDRATIEKTVTDVARLLRIEQLLDRRPHEVSGGQKQRTALGSYPGGETRCVPARRADQPSGCEDPPRAAAAVPHPAGAAPGGDGLRHPRLCRGPVARRPHRGDGRWRAGAGRDRPATCSSVPARSSSRAIWASRRSTRFACRLSNTGGQTHGCRRRRAVSPLRSADRSAPCWKARESEVLVGIRPQHVRVANGSRYGADRRGAASKRSKRWARPAC